MPASLPPAPSADQLLASCLAQDRQKQHQLYKTAMFSAALRMLGGDRDLAQDASQEAFMKAFQHLAEFRR